MQPQNWHTSLHTCKTPGRVYLFTTWIKFYVRINMFCTTATVSWTFLQAHSSLQLYFYLIRFVTKLHQWINLISHSVEPSVVHTNLFWLLITVSMKDIYMMVTGFFTPKNSKKRQMQMKRRVLHSDRKFFDWYHVPALCQKLQAACDFVYRFTVMMSHPRPWPFLIEGQERKMWCLYFCKSGSHKPLTAPA